ncbi:Protein of unknown function DUF460 [Methanosalsum zhilinae DSM 4017]|uniref:DUF460 domain-containing protein n=1 Tax=Methanosalsum zhilinae (strain DSM 4017 / NBRC 107636 / OCM 62 / WeN5) TaxID=679901 RepID=F7XK92_METZD|nr:DUF460 domain-containing protein [Methanosalsum zhilinae]AEH60557.1 Protein of unknown function DUF460 [Methanosalsum zhilinae DSM 4017]
MQNEIIYGIDIAKNSPRSRELPKYSVVVLKNGDAQAHNMVPRHRILKMVRNDHPSIIAVDNIFELASNKRELIHFLSKLPSDVKLVQVTGGITKKSLVRLAHENNISFNRFDPDEEAETCARLAAQGIGCEVSLFEDITKIKISRARSLGRGGWSQNRYRRKVHGAVKVKSREIESILEKESKEKDFTYSRKIVEGFGGYVRCEFTVNKRRDEISVKSSSTSDVQVNVRSVERDKIKYLPLKQNTRKFTIVGVDPGTTVGIAVLSLDGELLFLKSCRSISHDETVKTIAKYGKPVVVATDVTPTPSAVEKIRRSFNAVIGSPGEQIASEEKIALARSFNFSYSNDHERDALSAALFALKSYRTIFEKIDKKAPPNCDVDKVRTYVIQGCSVDEAIEKAVFSVNTGLHKSGNVRKESETESDDESRQMAENLKRKNKEINELMEYVLELKDEIAKKDQRISKLELMVNKLRTNAYKEIKKDKEIKIRNSKISRLKKELKQVKKSLHQSYKHSQKLKKIRKMEIKGEGMPVKVISAFTKEDISATRESYGLKAGDIVYLEDPSGGGAMTASILIDAGIRAVIVPDELSYAAQSSFLKSKIPVIKDIPLQRADDFAIVDPEILEKAILEWEEYEQEMRAAEEEQKLQFLIDEYRSKRKRGLV